MSDGIKAWHNDMDEWDAFKQKYDLKGVTWQEYSVEARIAGKLVSADPNLRGTILKLDVIHEREKQELATRHEADRKELIEALKLIKKFS